MPAPVELKDVPPCEPGYSFEASLFVSSRCLEDEWVRTVYTAWTVVFALAWLVMAAGCVRAYQLNKVTAVIICATASVFFAFLNSVGQLANWGLWGTLLTSTVMYGTIAIAAVTVLYRWITGVAVTHVTSRSTDYAGAHRPRTLVVLEHAYRGFTVLGPLPMAICFILAGTYGMQHEDFPKTYNKLIAGAIGWVALCAFVTAIALACVFFMLDRMLRRAKKTMERISPGSTGSRDSAYSTIRRRVWIFCIGQTSILFYGGILGLAIMAAVIVYDGNFEWYTSVQIYVLHPTVLLVALFMLVIEARRAPTKGLNGSSGITSSASDGARVHNSSSTAGGPESLKNSEPSLYLQNIDLKQLAPPPAAASPRPSRDESV